MVRKLPCDLFVLAVRTAFHAPNSSNWNKSYNYVSHAVVGVLVPGESVKQDINIHQWIFIFKDYRVSLWQILVQSNCELKLTVRRSKDNRKEEQTPEALTATQNWDSILSNGYHMFQ